MGRNAALHRNRAKAMEALALSGNTYSARVLVLKASLNVMLWWAIGM